MPHRVIMDFQNALNGLKAKHKVKRNSWSDRHLEIEHDGDKPTIMLNVKNLVGYIWVPTQEDILADDWELV